MHLLSRFGRLLEQVPGIRTLYDVVASPMSRFLYHSETLNYWKDRELLGRLPPGYRFCISHFVVGRSPYLASFALRLTSAFRSLIQTSDVCSLNVAGHEVYVNLRDPRFLAIPREISEGLPQILHRYLFSGDSFIDIGANHGSFSVVASSIVGRHGCVYAIEPQPQLAGPLRLSLSKGPARFEVLETAVGAREGVAELFVPAGSSGSAGIFGDFSARWSYSRLIVRMTQLDRLLENYDFSDRVVIKMDIEGGEAASLQGFGQLIRRLKPVLLLEVNQEAMRAAGTDNSELVGHLTDLGFDRFVTPGSPGNVALLRSNVSLPHDVILLHKERELINDSSTDH